MMMVSRRQSLITVCLSLALAYVLMMIPLPEVLRLLRPNLVVLAMIYWLARLPESVGVSGAFFIGLVYDGVIGSPLGLHALSFSLIGAALLLLYARWRMFTVIQQAIWIAGVLLLEQLVVAWAYDTVRHTELHGWIWVSALMGGLCWFVFHYLILPRQ